jgi:hypothetical protein
MVVYQATAASRRADPEHPWTTVRRDRRRGWSYTTSRVVLVGERDQLADTVQLDPWPARSSIEERTKARGMIGR